MVLLGSRHSANTLRLREFLSRNGHPYDYVDLDTDETRRIALDRFDVKPDEIPVLICNGADVLRNPSIQNWPIAWDSTAASTPTQVRDLVIVGAGPAGSGGRGLCGLRRA